MKSRVILALLAMLLFSTCIHGQGKLPGGHRYIYCNVYLDDVCFGVAAGETVVMTNAGDYTVYRVELSGGRKVDIYAGYNPSADVVEKVDAQACPGKISGECSYKIANEGSDILYRRSRESRYIHIHIHGRADVATFDFIRNFRACKSDDGGLRCENESIFDGLPLANVK